MFASTAFAGSEGDWGFRRVTPLPFQAHVRRVVLQEGNEDMAFATLRQDEGIGTIAETEPFGTEASVITGVHQPKEGLALVIVRVIFLLLCGGCYGCITTAAPTAFLLLLVHSCCWLWNDDEEEEEEEKEEGEGEEWGKEEGAATTRRM
jgi:hypothetical protein